MIAGLRDLEKRLEKLEPSVSQATVSPDSKIVELVISKLNDKELEILHEMSYLRESGFSGDQVREMIGDRCPQAQRAIKRFQNLYAEVVRALSPPPKLGRPPKKKSR
ncbi:MAG: hypothetical protein MUO26_12300 [Methanotrichaceae archaeon]|nr:hypothetical protein [Methanotrichaceae archaeon]